MGRREDTLKRVRRYVGTPKRHGNSWQTGQRMGATLPAGFAFETSDPDGCRLSLFAEGAVVRLLGFHRLCILLFAATKGRPREEWREPGRCPTIRDNPRRKRAIVR